MRGKSLAVAAATAVIIWIVGAFASHAVIVDEPVFSEVETAWLDQSIMTERMAQLEAHAGGVKAECSRAARAAKLSNDKSNWLRAHLLTFYQRYGQGRMATRLTEWPGGDSEPMKGIR